MLAEGRRLRVISSTEIRVTLGLATVVERRNSELPGLLFAKRYRAAEQTEFQRVPANSSAAEFHFGTFDETQDHEPLHHRVAGVYRLDDAFLATL